MIIAFDLFVLQVRSVDVCLLLLMEMSCLIQFVAELLTVLLNKISLGMCCLFGGLFVNRD